VHASLSDRLARHRVVASAAETDPDPDPDLEALLTQRLADSRATWPDVVLSDDDFLAYLASRLAPDVPLGIALRSACVTDLWLACAVARGDPAALRAFDHHCLRGVEAAIAHLDGGTALAADVRDAVRERVLSGTTGGPAKITEYRGRGDLRGWLRVVAVREALDVLRARRREAPLDRDAVLAERLDDAGPADMTTAERRVYRDAFASALATLSPRERNLLRQQYLYGATVDELAALYGVHRATAARWVGRVRELVLRRTRRHVGEALRLAGDELDSVMGRIASHLDYSLRHTLSIEP
jgi:RNA polymerase sigma-70 factor (ECF subfamily)